MNDCGMDIEAAMIAAEDEEDIVAMKVAKDEIAKEMDEFDEDAPVDISEDIVALVDKGDSTSSKFNKHSTSSNIIEDEAAEGALVVNTVEQEANDERDMEREFANWQASVGPDFRALENALKPIERYALKYRTEVDPYYSLFYISEQMKLDALKNEVGESGEWDVEEIEKEKEEEVASKFTS